MKKYNVYDVPMYQANSVGHNYNTWVTFLMNIALNVFTYENLPANLPAREIERRLICQGFAPVFRDPVAGLVTCWGNMTGFDIYDYPTDVTVSQARLGSANLKIGEDCEIIYNDSFSYLYKKTSFDIIAKYARLLADIQSSIAVLSVNSRSPVWAVAKDTPTQNAFREYRKKIENGDTDIMCTDNAIFETFQGVPSTTPSATGINELYDAFESTLKCFYREYGIRFIEQKKERVVTAEVTENDEILFNNISDMYANRCDGINKINEHFGTNIVVKISNGVGGTVNDYDI